MSERERQGPPPAIAVIGAACRFPGAPDLDRFWENLRRGVESISFFSREELLASGLDPVQIADPHYVPARGILEDIDLFDASFFGVTPREAELMDPQHRIFLEVAWEAIESAGYEPASYPGPIGLFAGEMLSTYLFALAADPARRALLTGQTLLGLDRDFLATLVSYKLDLRGPSVTVQTACSTSLVAVCLACQSLRLYDSDLALAGGVSVRVPSRQGHLYWEGGINSPDGHCRAYDAAARGTVGGDGAGVVVLKRLEDAVRDGDAIRAVLLGWAMNNDGALKAGYTAPSVEGQAEVIASALAQAGIDPGTVGFVEGHGTGTPLGDPIEFAALCEAFREAAAPRPFCALGSVKSNIGHLDSAAGVAGLLKAVLALERREIPPSLHFQAPNPEMDLAHSPFFVNTVVTPWADGASPRRAGVSSLGLGGTNAHVVLEQAPAPAALAGSEPGAGEAPPGAQARRSLHLLVLSARSAVALDSATARLAAWLDHRPGLELADVAYTLQLGRRAFEHRRTAVVSGLADAAAVLAELPAERVASGAVLPGRGSAGARAVFLFPGYGVPLLGAGRELYEWESRFRETVDLCAELLQSCLDPRLDLREVLYPPPGMEEAAAVQLRRTAVAQPALFALEYALAAWWQSLGVQPAAMIGYSLGEYVAACLAEVFSLRDALSLVAARALMMEQLPAGAMLAVPLPLPEVEELLRRFGGTLNLAAVNTPELCTVAGPEAAVEALRQQLAGSSGAGIACRRLAVEHAYHSAMMDPILESYRRRVAACERRPPRIPFVSNSTGTWVEPLQVVEPEYWARHARQPVRIAEGLAAMLSVPDGVLIEVGPGRTLAGLVRQVGEERTVLPTLPGGWDAGSEQEGVLAALGRFWIAGGNVDWHALHAGELRRRVALPTYPFERRRFWFETAPAAAAGVVRAASGGAAPPPGRPPAAAAGPVPSAASPAAARRPPRPPGSRAAGPLGRARPAHGRPEHLAVPYRAPRGESERQLAEVWEDLLGIAGIGIDDDFTALGGDSFRALELLARAGKVFGIDLPLRAVLEAPTVARMAERFASAAAGRPASAAPRLPGTLVEIQAGGPQHPLFLIHPAGGHVLGYRPLAARLGADRPVYGIEARGVAGDGEPHRSIEEMAAAHVATMLAWKPQGPYLLGGASLGGIVAWEMAQQLAARGEVPALVVLMDSPGPGQMPRRLRDDAEVICYLLGRGLGLSPGELRELPAEQRLPHALARAATAGLLPAELDLARARALMSVFKVHVRAMKTYRPRPYGGRVLFFRAAERRAADPPRPEAAWIDLALAGIEVVVVPGDHATLYQPPHVDVMAAKLERVLAAASRAEDRA